MSLVLRTEMPVPVSGLFFYMGRTFIWHEGLSVRIFFDKFLRTGDQICGRGGLVFFLKEHVKTDTRTKEGKNGEGNQENRLILP